MALRPTYEGVEWSLLLIHSGIIPPQRSIGQDNRDLRPAPARRFGVSAELLSVSAELLIGRLARNAQLFSHLRRRPARRDTFRSSDEQTDWYERRRGTRGPPTGECQTHPAVPLAQGAFASRDLGTGSARHLEGAAGRRTALSSSSRPAWLPDHLRVGTSARYVARPARHPSSAPPTAPVPHPHRRWGCPP